MRFRPASARSEGWSDAQLKDFCRSWAGQVETPVCTIEVDGFGMSWDDQTTTETADIIMRDVVDGDLIVLDLNFSRTIPRGFAACEELLYRALRHIADEGSLVAFVLVVVERLPTAADAVFQLLSEPDFNDRVLFVDITGGTLGGLNHFAPTMAASVPPAGESLAAIRNATIRRRGVFTTSASAESHYYLYYYDVLGDAQKRLRQVFRDYFIGAGSEVVLFDPSTAGNWFEQSIRGACTDVEAGSLDVSTLRSGDGSTERAMKLLLEPSTRVCYVVPAYQSGRTMSRLYRSAKRTDISTAAFLTVLYDEAMGIVEQETGFAGTFRTTKQSGREHYSLDYLESAPLRPIGNDDWKVRCATLLGEIEHVNPAEELRLSHPGRVAIWSLIEEYGASQEGADVVPISRKQPIPFYPNLGALNDWDAHWLAEAAVERIVEELGSTCSRDALYVVMPDENNASRRISSALELRCKVGVLPVPRSVIEGTDPAGDELLARLARHSGDAVVVFDEAAVSHGTLRRLGQLVESARGLGPDLYGVVLDLGDHSAGRPQPIFSFHKYVPLRAVANA